MNQEIIQRYINEFRRYISSVLKPNIGLEIDIYNCGNEGAVLIIFFKPGGKSIDKEINEFNTIADVLNSIEQNFVGGNISGMTFKGTNMMMDQNRILLIKESNKDEWSSTQLKEDLNNIFQPPSKKKKV
jgi:hypothetical protein